MDGSVRVKNYGWWKRCQQTRHLTVEVETLVDKKHNISKVTPVKATIESPQSREKEIIQPTSNINIFPSVTPDTGDVKVSEHRKLGSNGRSTTFTFVR